MVKQFSSERDMVTSLLRWEVFDRRTRKPLELPPAPPRRRRYTPLAPDDPRHGTPNGYNNHKCRCARCTKAWGEYGTARRRRRGIRPIGEVRAEAIRHNANRYAKGKCRCAVCREAATARRREARRKASQRAVKRAKLVLQEDE